MKCEVTALGAVEDEFLSKMKKRLQKIKCIETQKSFVALKPQELVPKIKLNIITVYIRREKYKTSIF